MKREKRIRVIDSLFHCQLRIVEADNAFLPRRLRGGACSGLSSSSSSPLTSLSPSTSTALSCSIKTGQIHYVERVLKLIRSALSVESSDMSMDEAIGRRVTHHHVTPLFYVLQLIGGVTRRGSLAPYQQSAYRYNVEQLRQIAALLIEAGARADTREANQNPPGFNAFWLAIQLDESEILSKINPVLINQSSINPG